MRWTIITILLLSTITLGVNATTYCDDVASPYYCELMSPVNDACRTYAQDTDPGYADACRTEGCCCSTGVPGYAAECSYAFTDNPTGNACTSVCEDVDLLDTLAPDEIVEYETLFDDAPDAGTFTRRLNEGYEHLSPADQQRMIEDLDSLLEVREDLVVESMLINPGSAHHLVELSLHSDLEAATDVEKLAEQAIDKDASISGYPAVFLAALADDKGPTRTQFIISEDSEDWYYVSTQEPDEIPLNPSEPIEMRGTSFQELMAVDEIEVQEGSPARYTFYEHASGDVRTLVSRLTVGDVSPAITTDQLEETYFAEGTYSVKDFWSDSSYEKANIAGSATDISIGELPGCDASGESSTWERIKSIIPLTFRTLGALAEESGGITNYDSFVVAGPSQTETCLSDFGTIGALRIKILLWTIIDASITYLEYPNDGTLGHVARSELADQSVRFRVPAHEFGHNLGLGHASRYECLDEAGRYVPISHNCWKQSYHNFDSIMGGNLYGLDPVGAISPYKRYFLGWLSNYNVAVAETDGAYTVYSSTLEPEPDRDHLLLVPISNGVGQFRGSSHGNLYYAIAYRPAYDKDYTNIENEHYGVTISLVQYSDAGWKWSNENVDEMLIDMRTLPGRELGATQSSGPEPWHQLLAGETFIDPYNGLSITLDEIVRYPDHATVIIERGPISPPDHASPVFDYDFTDLTYPTVPDRSGNDLDIHYENIEYHDNGISTGWVGLEIPRMTHNLLKQSNAFTIASTFYLPDDEYDTLYSFGFTELRARSGELVASTNFELNDLVRRTGVAPWIEQYEKDTTSKEVELTSTYDQGWNHIAVVYGSGAYELYLNGELVAQHRLDEGHWSITLDQSDSWRDHTAQRLRARDETVVNTFTGYRRALTPEEVSALSATTPTVPPTADEAPRINEFMLNKNQVILSEPFNASWNVYPDPDCELFAQNNLGSITYYNLDTPEGFEQLDFRISTREFGTRDLKLTCSTSEGSVSETAQIEYVECTEDEHCDGACILNYCRDDTLIGAAGSPEITLDVDQVAFADDAQFVLSYVVENVDLSGTDFCAGEGLLADVPELSTESFAIRGAASKFPIDTTVLGEDVGPREIEIVCGNDAGFTRASAEITLGECTEADVAACTPTEICHEFECKEPDQVYSGCVCEPDPNDNEIRRVTINECTMDSRPVCGPLTCGCYNPSSLPTITIEIDGIGEGDTVSASLRPSNHGCTAQGQADGTASCTINSVVPGEHTLVVNGTGYYEKRESIEIETTTNVQITLEAVPYPPPDIARYGYYYRYAGVWPPTCIDGCWKEDWDWVNTHPGGLDQDTPVFVYIYIPIEHVDDNTECVPYGFFGEVLDAEDLRSGSGRLRTPQFAAGTAFENRIGYECTNDAGTSSYTRAITVKPS